MIEDVKKFLKTGKKSATNAIIWEDNKIYGLVIKINKKTKKRKKFEKKERFLAEKKEEKR
jgi:hypothetical protein